MVSFFVLFTALATYNIIALFGGQPMLLYEYLKLFLPIEYSDKNKYKNHDISIFTDDTRKCQPLSVFFAIKGTNIDGHNFIDEAIKKGSKTIICERIPKKRLSEINYVKVKSSLELYHQILMHSIKDELKKIKIIGITGTNGKTTVATLTYGIFKYLNISVLFVGTNGSYVYNARNKKEIVINTPNTTPKLSIIVDIIKTYPKINYLIMEVSSEALERNRIGNLKFDTVVFTNLGHDHLDSHLTINEYRNAKLKLFALAKRNGNAIVNIDDKNAKYFLKYAKNKRLNIKTFGIINGDFRGEILSINKDYMMIKVFSNNFEYVIGTNLLGNFNLLNILSVLAIIESEKIPLNHILGFFEKQLIIKGRYEKYYIHNRNVYIDYAHNPDAIREFLKLITKIKENKRIITVIGAGGQKDVKKRPKMGKYATFYSTLVIFTEDNSRNESVKNIISDLTSELTTDNYTIEYNREIAISKAFKISDPNDYIILLGMGLDLYSNGKNDLQMAKEVVIDE